MPNPNTIKWLHYQDIQIPDVPLRQQFQSYCAQGDFTNALRLLKTNESQLVGKAYIADTINTITNGILNLEDRFNKGIILYLSSIGAQWQELIDNIQKRGLWLTAKQYKKNNFVVYNENIYMALKDVPTGTPPTNTEYWLYLGLRGREGAHGVGVTMRYDWNNTTNYNANDLVVYDDNIYVALQSNTGVEPNTNESIWSIFLYVEKGQIHVGNIPPNTEILNTVWFQTTVDPITYTGNEPITGQFKRYTIVTTETGEQVYEWEDMFPNILFHSIENTDNLANKQIIINTEIKVNDWINSQWTYKNSDINEKSLLYILPQENVTTAQYSDFNKLNNLLIVENKQFTLTANSAITQNIPIRIIIA